MRRIICQYGLIVGVFAGLLLAIGCAGETPESVATSVAPTAARPTDKPPSTVQRPTATPTSTVDSAKSVEPVAAAGGGAGDNGVTPIPGSRAGGTSDKAEVEYLEFDGVKAVPFSINAANTLRPEDILQHIYWFGGFGGGGVDPCEQYSPSPFIVARDENRTYELLDTISVDTCAWQPGEMVTVTITKPNGEVISQTGSRAWYQTTLDDPLGEYEVVFRGSSTELRTAATLVLPEEPRLHIRDNELLLQGFRPNENVRLLIYKDSFNSWATLEVDAQGKLVVELDAVSMPTDYQYRVISEDGDEVPHLGSGGGRIADATALTEVAIEMGGPVFFTSNGHDLRRPSENSIQNLKSIWSFVPYKDLLEPGTNVYDVRLNNREYLLWRFSWCARDDETLQAILEPLTLRFLVSDEELPSYMLVQDEAPGSGGWACRWWTTSIERWPTSEISEFTIEYNLETDIYDGATHYPAGTYRHVIRVSN